MPRRIILCLLLGLTSLGLWAQDIDEELRDFFFSPIGAGLTNEEQAFAEQWNWPLKVGEWPIMLLSLGGEQFISPVIFYEGDQTDPFLSIIEEAGVYERDLLFGMLQRIYNTNCSLDLQIRNMEAQKELLDIRYPALIEEYNQEIEEFNAMGETRRGMSALATDENGVYLYTIQEIDAMDQAIANLEDELEQKLKLIEYMEKDFEALSLTPAFRVEEQELAEKFQGYLEAYTDNFGNRILPYISLIDYVYGRITLEEFQEVAQQGITVTSSLTTTEIYWEGRLLGTAPLEIPWLLPGEFELEARQNWFYPQSRSIVAGVDSTVHFEMLRMEEEETSVETDILGIVDSQAWATLNLSSEDLLDDIVLISPTEGRFTANTGVLHLPAGVWRIKTYSEEGSGSARVDLDPGQELDLEVSARRRLSLTGLVGADLRIGSFSQDRVADLPMFNFGLRMDYRVGSAAGLFIKTMTAYSAGVQTYGDNILSTGASMIEERLSLGFHYESSLEILGWCFGIGPALDYMLFTVESPFQSEKTQAAQLTGGIEGYIGGWFGPFYMDFGYYQFFDSLQFGAVEGGGYLDPSAVFFSIGYRHSFIPKYRGRYPSIDVLEEGGY